MKTLNLLAAAALVAVPALTFAQSIQAPVTRAQVVADLVRVEKAGYNPFRISNDYPADIQAAEAKLSAQAGTTVSTASTASTVTQPRVMKMASMQGGQATYRIDRPRNPFFDGA